MQIHPVQRLTIKLLLIQPNIRLLLPPSRVQPLENTKKHQQTRLVNTLIRIQHTRYSAGLTLMNSLFYSVGSNEN
jgi:hypothetical protein